MTRPPNLVVIPTDTNPTKCSKCKQLVYFVKHPTGAYAPFIPPGHILLAVGKGYDHHIDCPHAASFTRTPRPSVKQHKCAATTCKKLVPVHLLMCPKDWALVSPMLQREVYRQYRRGQENDGGPPITRAYIDAVRNAVAYVDKIREPAV